jgi:protein TonB
MMQPAAETLSDPSRLRRRRSDGGHGRQTRDRLTTMLVLAGLLHGLVILGISFSTPYEKSQIDRGMEVVLVADELPEARDNPTATYLSQRTQTGSGNTQERRNARLPSPSREEATAAAKTAAPAIDVTEQLLSSNNGRRPTAIQVLPVPESPGSAANDAPASRKGDDELVLRGVTRDELYVSADTQASRLAPYLDAWRRRVERVGTLNFPTAARRRGLTGNPVIEVTLRRDGRLQAARIQRSSGHAQIDAAALEILRLASPFDPFPTELARDYRTLRFPYEWRFEAGEVPSGTVPVP